MSSVCPDFDELDGKSHGQSGAIDCTYCSRNCFRLRDSGTSRAPVFALPIDEHRILRPVGGRLELTTNALPNRLSKRDSPYFSLRCCAHTDFATYQDSELQ
jgi:hypothetical protein